MMKEKTSQNWEKMAVYRALLLMPQSSVELPYRPYATAAMHPEPLHHTCSEQGGMWSAHVAAASKKRQATYHLHKVDAEHHHHPR